MTEIASWIKKCTILQGVVGSTAHGLNLERNDDRDELGICIEPIEEFITLGEGFSQTIFRTAAERWIHQDTCPCFGLEYTGKLEGEAADPGKKCDCTPYKKHDARSQAGDEDITIFSLRKFCRLAAAGNPSVLLLLFTPQLTYHNALGSKLREMAPLFVSKEAGSRFLGYMKGQKERLLGQRGQKRIKRPELEEMYGYDTKYAMHVLRLGLQGIELMYTGKLTLPMKEADRTHLMDIRLGKSSKEDVIRQAIIYEEMLKTAVDKSPLPPHPDRPAIEKWMQERYLAWWSASRPLMRPKEDEIGFKEIQREGLLL